MLLNFGSLSKGCAEIDVIQHMHWGMSSPFCGNCQVKIFLENSATMCMILRAKVIY